MLSHSHHLENLLKDEYHLVWIITLNHATYSLKKAFCLCQHFIFQWIFRRPHIMTCDNDLLGKSSKNTSRNNDNLIWQKIETLQGLYVNVKREGIHRKTTHTYTWPRILTKCKIAITTTILACIHVRRRTNFACQKFHLTTQTSKKSGKRLPNWISANFFRIFAHAF